VELLKLVKIPLVEAPGKPEPPSNVLIREGSTKEQKINYGS
jgi:hypothetical protein